MSLGFDCLLLATLAGEFLLPWLPSAPTQAMAPGAW